MNDIKYILYLNWNYALQTISSQKIWENKKQFDFNISVINSTDQAKIRLQGILDTSDLYRVGSTCKISLIENNGVYTGKSFAVIGYWTSDELNTLSNEDLTYGITPPRYLIPIKADKSISGDIKTFTSNMQFVDELGTLTSAASTINSAYPYIYADVNGVTSGGKNMWNISLSLGWYYQNGTVLISNLFNIVNVTGTPNNIESNSLYKQNGPAGIWVDRMSNVSSEKIENTNITNNILFLSIAAV